MDRESSPGLMAGSTRDSGRTAGKTATESSLGRMAGSTTACGEKDSTMGLATTAQRASLAMATGSMVLESLPYPRRDSLNSYSRTTPVPPG